MHSSRKNKPQRCSVCGGIGHKSRTCQQEVSLLAALSTALRYARHRRTRQTPYCTALYPPQTTYVTSTGAPFRRAYDTAVEAARAVADPAAAAAEWSTAVAEWSTAAAAAAAATTTTTTTAAAASPPAAARPTLEIPEGVLSGQKDRHRCARQQMWRGGLV